MAIQAHRAIMEITVTVPWEYGNGSTSISVGIALKCVHKDPISYYKDSWKSVFNAALYITSRNLKQPKCSSTDGRIIRMYSYTAEYYSLLRKIK